MKNRTRQSKYVPLVKEVQLIEANPMYVRVQLPNGNETTSTRHFAPCGELPNKIVQEPAQDFILPSHSDSSDSLESITKFSWRAEHITREQWFRLSDPTTVENDVQETIPSDFIEPRRSSRINVVMKSSLYCIYIPLVWVLSMCCSKLVMPVKCVWDLQL